ncbi:DUF1800 domain-containing protein [Pleurocapsales cyanobacterium LEGE 10410]|nr:DUF1800 domain-containing protein [Pleurocapsales cyanobacterium LEGE 10410]
MRQKLQYWTGILLFSLILWLGLINRAEANSELSQAHQRHILERLSFGVTSEQMQQVKAEGIEAYIQSQLTPELVEEPPILNNYLAKLSLIHQKPTELQKKVNANRKKVRNSGLSIEQKQKIRQEIREMNTKARDEAINAHLARAIYSSRQLKEVMVDFWFNHFNIYADKGDIRLWLSDYEQKIRPHALGNFRDLLAVTARHPAMIIYLDNKKNTAPDSPVGIRGKLGLNENYARELMELHTMGVDGGYTQDDVIALARIFTGWGVDYEGKRGDKKGFFFYKNRHDRHDKTFLGHKIAANGIKEGEQALDILASHPATAHHISYKLAEYFVSDRPPSSLVDRLAQKFLDSDGNIKVVLDTLIHSAEFNDPQYYQQKFTTPYQYIVSLVRMAEIEQPNFKRIRGMLQQLSMPVYRCPLPTGYKNTQSAWLNPQAMLQRTGFATAIARGTLNPGYSIPYKQLQRNSGELSERTKQVIAKTPPKLRSALMMGSPEAMYR